MDWIALLKTVGLCLISILIEAISATKAGKLWFEKLKRPKYSFSLRIWYFVGAAYYIIFGIIAYRQFSINLNTFSTPIILLALVMILNGLGNFIIFKYRSLKWFYLLVYPFGFLLIGLILTLYKSDRGCRRAWHLFTSYGLFTTSIICIIFGN